MANKRKIRIGVIYAPQENVTLNSELKHMYESIAEQIQKGKEEKQQIVIIGDFNAKIGTIIEGNNKLITKGGRQLMKLVRKENMTILNAVKDKCKGKWTRIQGEEKSIIDYIITETLSVEKVKEMKIDEERQYGLYKLEKNTKNENKKIYSDHHAILINLDFETVPEEIKPSKIITSQGYKRYKRILEEENISKIVENGQLQESYDNWSLVVENTIKKVQRTKKKNTRKDIKEIQEICKNLRKEYSNEKQIHEKMLIIERIKILKEHIVEKYKEIRSKKINHIAEEIRANVDNGGKIWEVKRKLKRRMNEPYCINNAEGVKLEDRTDILEEYKNYYSQLLKTREADDEFERLIEKEVEQKFQKLIANTVQTEKITEKMIKAAINKLKNNKASDRLGWRAEWIKEGGEEMIKSLSILFNRIEMEVLTPVQWRQTIIKSTYKGGNKAHLHESQRGIFLANIVSKVYEIVKITQNVSQNNNMSNMQTAGRKQRSTWIT